MIYPQKFNLYLYKGATFNYIFYWRDETGALVNLTGYSARMHMRVAVEMQPVFDVPKHEEGILLGAQLEQFS